ncbi:uncharacterized protein METZ01_LOCUS236831, partial [marine metagenome]
QVLPLACADLPVATGESMPIVLLHGWLRLCPLQREKLQQRMAGS